MLGMLALWSWQRSPSNHGPTISYSQFRAELARKNLESVRFHGEIVTGDRAAYRYLAESIRRFPDQDTFAKMIAAAGLEQVTVRNLSGGIAAIHSAWRI